MIFMIFIFYGLPGTKVHIRFWRTGWRHRACPRILAGLGFFWNDLALSSGKMHISTLAHVASCTTFVFWVWAKIG